MDLAHVHLMLNHVPVLGVMFGLAVGAIGFVLRSKPVIRVGLGMLVASAVVAVPVYLTGDTAEELVEGLPGVSEAVAHQHESAASVSIVLIAISGLLALVTLLFVRTRTISLASYLTFCTLLVTLFAAGSLAWTANLGGQIRHTEIRGTTTDPASANGVSDKKGETKREDDD